MQWALAALKKFVALFSGERRYSVPRHNLERSG
jgi:hypothetical protein